MHLEGLAKFERNKVFKEVPPVKDEKGEATEVQVLEEGDVYVGVFDPDEFLEKLEQFHTSMPAMSSSQAVPLPGNASKENVKWQGIITGEGKD